MSKCRHLEHSLFTENKIELYRTGIVQSGRRFHKNLKQLFISAITGIVSAAPVIKGLHVMFGTVAIRMH